MNRFARLHSYGERESKGVGVGNNGRVVGEDGDIARVPIRLRDFIG